MSPVTAVARKEIRAAFVSPMAAIFLGAFLLVTLFTFFWVETFFARNLADVRPMFRWMPTLLIFLVSALTMRQWSEEQKMGTLEILLTLPIRIRDLVVGKFLATMALVAMALLLTAGLPVTVSMIGPLDWGPVLGGYAGALLLASAYASIGLFISSRTDNQINALIVTVLALSGLYLIGSPGVTDFVGNRPAEILRLLGTGSRFASIERGVIDLRDVAFYGSLTVFFLVLNTVSLDAKRWSTGASTAKHRRGMRTIVVLAGLNLLALNFWLQPVQGLRLDLTQTRQYSISDTTRDALSNLTEPLLLRGYFSSKTHPLLAPLVPTIRDLMTEYKMAGGGRVVVEFIDPRENEEAETEANQSYGIKPVPFQISGRYEASVVNSYFDILVKYGDQYTVLNFRDLIEVQSRGETGLDVRLRNLEYDLTRAIKKVTQGFQGVDAILASSSRPILLKAFITPETLPEELSALPERIRKVAGQLEKESSGKFALEVIDPDTKDSPLTREELLKTYGFQPIALSLLSEKTFFMYLALHVGDDIQRILPAPDMTEAELRTEIESALKRGASGFLKTVGLWTPGGGPSPYGMPEPGANHRMIREQLSQSYNVKDVDLSSGRVPGDVDVLAVVSPQSLTEIELYAVDQFLMRGGAVIAAAGRYILDTSALESGSLGIQPVEGSLDGLLEHYGVKVEKALVLDRQNEPFPVPVVRNLGAFQVREIRQMNYPFFVDVRKDGMAKNHPMVSALPAVTLHWASPVTVDAEKSGKRETVILLQSSEESWQDEDVTRIQPDFEKYPDLGFPADGETGRRTLAVSMRGGFDSYFAGKPAPKPQKKANPMNPMEPAMDSAAGDATSFSTIEHSPDTARLVVIGSSEFLNDLVMNISRSSGQDRFMNSLEFLQNAVDWSVEDEDLLAIRSRGSHTRLLAPLSREAQAGLEWTNYGIALTALIVVSLYASKRRRHEKPMELV